MTTQLGGYETVGYSAVASTPTQINIATQVKGVLPAANLPTYQNAATGAVARTIISKLQNLTTTPDFGTVGDGSTDDGTKIANAVAASNKGLVVFPHTTNGYVLNSGTFAGGTYPNFNWSTSNTGVYGPVGFYMLGNNRFQGSAIGSADNCTGTIFSPYTQTCLAITDFKFLMDPASIWAGPNTTNTGMDIGCLPNHKSSNAANVTGSYYRNWIACMYLEADTGTDGQANSGGSGFGSSISTETISGEINIGSNSGIYEEVDVNVYGGITRGYFLLSSAGNSGGASQTSILAGYSPWSKNSGFAMGMDIEATPFTTTTKPTTQTNGSGETVYSLSGSTYTVHPRWTRGLYVSGSVNDIVAGQSVTGESGNYFKAINSAGSTVFYVDKNANILTNGNITAMGYGSFTGSIQLNGAAANRRYMHLDTSGTERWEVGEDPSTESGSNAGSNFYIARKSDAGASLDQPITINRASGSVTIADGLAVGAQITSTVATGTAPFVVASSTNVANLNASSLNGATFAAPSAIDSTTASTGAFTTLKASIGIAGAGIPTLAAGATAQVGTGATIVCASGHVCDQFSGEITLTTDHRRHHRHGHLCDRPRQCAQLCD